MFISVVAVAVAVNYCIHYKHATVEQMCGGKSFTVSLSINIVTEKILEKNRTRKLRYCKNSFNFQTSHRGAYRLFVLLIWSAPCLLYIGQHRELEGALLFVKIVRYVHIQI